MEFQVYLKYQTTVTSFYVCLYVSVYNIPVVCSRNPVSRFEVKQLKKTMSDMMLRLGISDAGAELKGPTQVTMETT